MKVASVVALLILTACSSKRGQEDIPPFHKDKVCSDESLTYLKNKKYVGPNRYSVDEIRSRMLASEPLIRKCYEEDMERNNSIHSFNLCFVVGFNPKGVMEYFEFSTKEISLTNEFKTCLEKLKKSDELKNLNDISIVQPYRLFPKR